MIHKMALTKTALITGASAGIGREFARVLAAEGYNLVLVARRQKRLKALADELEKNYDTSVLTISADLANVQAPRKIADEIAAQDIQIDFLVNNAGYGLIQSYRKSSWQEQADLIQVMLTAPTELCHLFVPQMAERGYGRVVNVASVAGSFAGMNRAVLYAPIKTFLIRLSQDISLEYRGRGVNVVALCPGFTLSEFHDVNNTREQLMRLPSFLWLSSMEVARTGYQAAEYGRGPRIVNGWPYKIFTMILKFIPENIATRIFALAAPSARRSAAKPVTAKHSKASAQKITPGSATAVSGSATVAPGSATVAPGSATAAPAKKKPAKAKTTAQKKPKTTAKKSN